jgi:tetratricopeptide (TPR) repeat protein
LAAIRRRHDDALKQSAMADANGISATDAALKVAMLIDFAQDQLSYKQNPQRAWDYASRAETTLSGARANFAKDDPLGISLDKLAPAIYSMKAQCAWKLGDMDKVEAAAKAAIDAAKDLTSADALEANYYMGLSELKRAIDEDAARGGRQALISAAINSLQKAAEGKNQLHTGGHPQLFLVAALAEAGRYRTAIDEADSFLADFPKASEERKRLDKELQAQIALATTWRAIAEFCKNNGGSLEIPSCGMDVGAIGTREGELFDMLLEQFVRFKNERVRHPITALELGYYCADMMGAIRTASQSAGCGGAPGGDAPQDVAERYNFEVPFSTDESLGFIRDGVLAMKYVEYHNEERTRTREVDGQTIDETYTVKLHHVVECEIDDEERPIPSRRYIPYDLADKYLPFSLASSGFSGEQADPTLDAAPPAEPEPGPADDDESDQDAG